MVNKLTRTALSSWADGILLGRGGRAPVGCHAFALASSRRLFFSKTAQGVNALDRAVVCGQRPNSRAAPVLKVGWLEGGRAVLLAPERGRSGAELIHAGQGGAYLATQVGEYMAELSERPVCSAGFDPINGAFSTASSSWARTWLARLQLTRRRAERQGQSLGALGDEVWRRIASRVSCLDGVRSFVQVHGGLSPHHTRFESAKLVQVDGWERGFWGDALCQWAPLTEVDAEVRAGVIAGFGVDRLSRLLQDGGAERLALYSLSRVFTELRGASVSDRLAAVEWCAQRARLLLATDNGAAQVEALLLNGAPLVEPRLVLGQVARGLLLGLSTVSDVADLKRWLSAALSALKPQPVSGLEALVRHAIGDDLEGVSVDFVSPTGGWSLLLLCLGEALCDRIDAPPTSALQRRVQLFRGLEIAPTDGAWRLALLGARAARAQPVTLSEADLQAVDLSQGGRQAVLWALVQLDKAGALNESLAQAKERVGLSWSARW